MRYVFELETYIYTYRNLFKSLAPSATDLFAKIDQSFRDGQFPERKYDNQTISLKKIQVSAGEAVMLFWLTDPSIPDPDFAKVDTGTLRNASRLTGEEPAISAHLFVKTSASQDQRKSYETYLENVDFLSRSSIQKYLNDIFNSIYSENRLRIGESEPKKYSPRVQFRAPYSETLNGILDSGGVLTGVHALEEKLEETAFGDPAHPVFSRNQIEMKIENRPTGSVAKSILNNAWESLKGRDLKRVSVVIEDEEEEKTKRVRVDLKRQSILENIFVRQRSIGEFSPALRQCEPSIRSDVVAAIRQL